MSVRQPIAYNGRAEVSKACTVPIPVKDEDGDAKNLDGLTVTARTLDPDGTGADATSAAQRTAGSNIADVVFTPDQAGPWVVALYIDSELVEKYVVQAEAAI